METFTALLARRMEIHRSPVISLHKGQWRGALMLLICIWINGWVNNREAGDLRRHRAHYDVTVMNPSTLFLVSQINPYDDVMTWKHSSHNWPFVRGIHRSPEESSHKGHVAVTKETLKARITGSDAGFKSFLGHGVNWLHRWNLGMDK